MYWDGGVFSKCFIEFSKFSDKIFVITVNGLKPASSCVRDQDDSHSTSKTHVRDGIFKLSPIYASVIYQIPRICWIHWIQRKFIFEIFLPLLLRIFCKIYFPKKTNITKKNIKEYYYQRWADSKNLKNLNDNYNVDVLPSDCTANTLSTMILNICDTIVHVLEQKLLDEVYAFHVSNIFFIS